MGLEISQYNKRYYNQSCWPSAIGCEDIEENHWQLGKYAFVNKIILGTGSLQTVCKY